MPSLKHSQMAPSRNSEKVTKPDLETRWERLRMDSRDRLYRVY